MNNNKSKQLKNNEETTEKKDSSTDTSTISEDDEKSENKEDSNDNTSNDNSNKTNNNDDKKEYEDGYITASGYAGASDNVYYTKNGVLYHEKLSTKEKTKLAEGVKKIELDIETLIAYKGKNFKIIKEDNYVTYKD